MRACVVAAQAHSSPPKGRHCGVVLRVLGHRIYPCHDHESMSEHAYSCVLPRACACHQKHAAPPTTHLPKPKTKQNGHPPKERIFVRPISQPHTQHNASDLALGPGFGSTMFSFLFIAGYKICTGYKNSSEGKKKET